MRVFILKYAKKYKNLYFLEKYSQYFHYLLEKYMRAYGRENIPENHEYFRSSAIAYAKYLESCGLKIIPIGNSFGWAKKVFGNFWGVMKFDRIDTPPGAKEIESSGLKHGIIIWIPWRKLPEKIFLKKNRWHKLFAATHFQHTGIGVVSQEYWKNWNSRAERARKKFLSFQVSENLIIEKIESETWRKYFLTAKTRIPLKSSFAHFHEKISHLSGENTVHYICRKEENILGGLSVFNYDVYSSVHLLSFLPDTGKKYQVGTGLIDFWYQESLKKGITNIHFDHLQEHKKDIGQKGYSDFKMNFINIELKIPESYIKWF